MTKRRLGQTQRLARKQQEVQSLERAIGRWRYWLGILPKRALRAKWLLVKDMTYQYYENETRKNITTLPMKLDAEYRDLWEAL